MKLMREIIRKQDVRFWAEDQMQAFDSADLPKTMIVPAA